jgi:hypothetical protein
MPHRYIAFALLSLVAACSDPGPGNGAASIDVPFWAAVVNGDSLQLTAIVVASQGDTIPSPSVTWSSSSPSVAPVSSTGMVRGLSLGSATIRASYQGKTDSTAAIVAQPVLVGAGDIANCTLTADDSTAALLDTIPGIVFAAGDNAYSNGTILEYQNCYDPTWGRHKDRTRPSPGNHEYNSLGVGYFQYFGQLAGDSGAGYYSFDFARWHLVSLNSNVARGPGSPQEQWLRADLAAHPATCTLAYWHHPRFNSGTTHGNDTTVGALWQALYDVGADVVISGHEHLYERFAPQGPDSTLNAATGIREFVVGTGGANLYAFGTPRANSEVRNAATHGVIALTLNPTGYAWRYITTTGAVADSGSAACH